MCTWSWVFNLVYPGAEAGPEFTNGDFQPDVTQDYLHGGVLNVSHLVSVIFCINFENQAQ